ncbi:MAG: AAA family ATPase [Oligoflexia bacterium]|nr:AAA family ATPase [Oligoflexia bacterium]
MNFIYKLYFKISTVLFIFLSIFIFSNHLSNVKGSTEELLKAENGLKNLSTNMREKYSEMDSYLDILLMALLTEQHVLGFGGPGGSKTQTAQEVLKVLKGKLFSLQFSPNTKQEKIIGSIKGKEFLESGKIEYLHDQSLLKHEYAILDEIDKANTEVLASALSVLLERKAMVGDQEVKGNLKTALITSNMTLYEFLEKFKNTNDGSTGMALLDRILFKVLVLNRLSSAEELFKVMSKCKSNNLTKSEGECPLVNDLDLHILKKQIKKIKVPDEVQKLATHLWYRLSQRLEKKQQEDETLCSEDPKNMPFPYSVTNQFTNRGAINNLIKVMKVAKYLEEIKKNKGNDKTLLDTQNIVLTPEDILLTQNQMILQGPGKVEPGTPECKNNCPAGKLLTKIRNQYLHNPRTLKMIDDLIFERTSFANEYLEILKIYQEELAALGSVELMKKLSSGAKDLGTLSEKDRKEIYLKISQIKEKIKLRRSNEFSKDESSESVTEVAREKVLQDMDEIEKMLELSKKAEEEMALKLKEELQKEENIRLQKEKKLKDDLREENKRNSNIKEIKLAQVLKEKTENEEKNNDKVDAIINFSKTIKEVKFAPNGQVFAVHTFGSKITLWKLDVKNNKWIDQKLDNNVELLKIYPWSIKIDNMKFSSDSNTFYLNYSKLIKKSLMEDDNKFVTSWYYDSTTEKWIPGKSVDKFTDNSIDNSSDSSGLKVDFGDGLVGVGKKNFNKITLHNKYNDYTGSDLHSGNMFWSSSSGNTFSQGLNINGYQFAPPMRSNLRWYGLVNNPGMNFLSMNDFDQKNNKDLKQEDLKKPKEFRFTQDDDYTFNLMSKNPQTNGWEIKHKLKGHKGNVTFSEFSDDREHIITSSEDATIIWDVIY